MRRLRLALILLVFTLTAPLAGAQAPGEGEGGLFMYNRKVPQPLPVDEGSFLVQEPGGNAAAIAEQLRRLGRADFRAAGGPRDGYFLFTRQDASSTPLIGGVASVIRELSGVLEGFVSPVMRRGEHWSVFKPEVKVRFVAGTPYPTVRQVLQPWGRITERDYGGMAGVYRLEVTTRSGVEALAIANQLAVRADVLWAQVADTTFGPGPSQARFMPDDEYFQQGLQWGVDHVGYVAMWGPQQGIDVNGPEVWVEETGTSEVIFLVMDSGVQKQSGSPSCGGVNGQNHPDVTFTYGYDATDLLPQCAGRPTNACESHGTFVAGVVSAFQDNLEGITGVAPGVVLASARAFGVEGAAPVPPTCIWRFEGDFVVSALQWAESLAAAGDRRVVTNYSANAFGGPKLAMEDKYFETWKAGMVHFVSAGNGSLPTVQYPAGIPGVNGITNLTYEGTQPQLRPSSSRGPGTDFAAPGTFILTTDPTGPLGTCTGQSNPACIPGELDYHYATGTSFASPMAAGVAALVLSKNPKLSAQGVEWVMRQTAFDLGPAGWDDDFGWGLPCANVAVELAERMIFYDGFETGTTECWGSTNCSGGN